jgi:hypothetical protein
MAKRGGRTAKISISIDKNDFELLNERAKRLSGGNVSAAVTQLIHAAREWEGRQALATWLGAGREEPSPEVMNAIRAEWRGSSRRKRRRRPS